ncbi:uncharacterized protein V6R79_005241 [Siganus canaliculatus]
MSAVSPLTWSEFLSAAKPRCSKTLVQSHCGNHSDSTKKTRHEKTHEAQQTVTGGVKLLLPLSF